MEQNKIAKLASKLMIEIIKTDLPNKEINRLNDILADIRELAINYTRCCESDSEQLKTFNIHQCINEISIEANRCDRLFYDIGKDKSFRYNVKKAIDKMLYRK